MSQDWKNLTGAQAFHLIERHADGWDDIERMMNEWLAAQLEKSNAAHRTNPDHVANTGKLIDKRLDVVEELRIVIRYEHGRMGAVSAGILKSVIDRIEASNALPLAENAKLFSKSD